MNRSSVSLALRAFAALLMFGCVAHASPLLSVDINSDNNLTEGGAGEANSNDSPAFHGFVIPSAGEAGPASQTYSGIIVTIAGGSNLTNATSRDGSGNLNSTGTILTRDRGAPLDAESPANSNMGFTFGELYRDFVTANAIGIELSGLAANTSYDVIFYAYDNNGNRTQTFTDITSGSPGASGTVTYTAASSFTASTPNSIFSTKLTATSDSQGRLIFSETGVGTSGSTSVALFNGLQIIPEPASMSLLAVGSLVLLPRRRRRTRH